MAFYDNKESQATSAQNSTATSWSDWLDIGANSNVAVELTALNVGGPLAVGSGLNDQTLDWSIEHTANFADSAEAVAELFTSANFTQLVVPTTTFPNKQTAYFGIGDSNNLAKNSKRYIRVKATLAGTKPVATWQVKVLRVGGSVGGVEV